VENNPFHRSFVRSGWGTQDPRASIEALEAFVKIVGQRMEAST
jgi:hypothetical protein